MKHTEYGGNKHYLPSQIGDPKIVFLLLFLPDFC